MSRDHMNNHPKNNHREGNKIGHGAKGPGGGMAMGRPTAKAKDFKGTFKRLLSYLKPYRLILILTLIMAVLGTTFSIVAPKITSRITDTIYEGVISKTKGLSDSLDFTKIGNLVLILLGLYILSSLFTYVMQYFMAGLAQKVVCQLRLDASTKLKKLPLKYYDSRTHGEILSRFTNDMDNISNTLSQSIMQFITAIITIIGSIIMMLTISPFLTLIIIITLPLSIIITMQIAKRSQVYFKKQQKVIGELNGHVEEMYTGHKIIRAFNKEADSINEFSEINENLYDAGWKSTFISGIIMPLMNFVNNLGYVLVCVVGGLLVANGRITLGSIQAFFMYSRSFGQPIVQTANIANLIQSTIASAERVFELMDELEELDENNITQFPTSINGHVTFNHVKFGYSKDKVLMKDIDINIKPGQTIAIVGPTGAGKTTLVNLLMRFYELHDGSIKVDGININDFLRGDLRNMFGMVLQDTWLFKGSIKDNIAYAKDNASELEIIQAAKLANAHHFIKTLPDGYDTILNEDATNISQGQKQLLTIARAILAKPSILILDEATSSVDTRTELHIQEAMGNLMSGHTSFVIAHRLSTIRHADLILVMNEGDIIEQGNHEDLLAKNGFYANLYNSQFAS